LKKGGGGPQRWNRFKTGGERNRANYWGISENLNKVQGEKKPLEID